MNLRITAWLVLAMAFVVLLFNSGARFAIGLMLHPMVEELDWSRTTLASVVTVFMIISAAALPFTGRLVDRFGAMQVLAAGVLLSAIPIALMSIIKTPLHAFVLYGVFFALGSAATSITPIGVVVSKWFPNRIGMANSVAISGMGVGQLLIIAVLTSQLMSIGWRSAYLYLGIAIALFVMPLIITVSRAGRDKTASATAVATAGNITKTTGCTLGQSLRKRRMWLLLLMYAICGFQDFVIATHIVAFALDEQVSAAVAGNMLAFMGLAGLAGVLLTGFINDRRGPVYPTMICFVLRVLIFTAILYSRSPVVIVTCALLYGSTFWITAPLTVVYAKLYCGMAYLGSITGMITMVHHMFGGVGAFVGARLFDTSGTYDSTLVLMLVLSVAGLVITAGLDQREEFPTVKSAPN